MKLLKTFENFKENEIDIELEDFLGEKFKLRVARKSGTPLNLNHIYTQDEVEMVIEDFKLIADVHNLKLANYHNYPDLNEELIYYGIYVFLDLDYEEIYISLNDQVDEDNIDNILEDEDFLSDLDVFINQQENIGLIVEIDFNIHSIIIKKNRNLKNIYLKDYKFIKENYNGIENIILKDYQGNSFNIIGNAYGHPLLPKERLPIGKYPMTFTKDEVEMIIEDFNVIADLHNLRMVNYSGRYVDTEDTYYIGVFFDFYQYKKYHICIEIETENYDEDLRSDIHSFITQQNNMGYSIDTESDENDNVWQILIFKK